MASSEACISSVLTLALYSSKFSGKYGVLIVPFPTKPALNMHVLQREPKWVVYCSCVGFMRPMDSPIEGNWQLLQELTQSLPVRKGGLEKLEI